MILEEILDHLTSQEAIEERQGIYVTKTGNIRKIKTTVGWELLVLWKENTHDWVKLKDLKEFNPVELMEYTTRKKIDKEPAFAWWVPNVHQKLKIFSKSEIKVLGIYT